MRFCVRGEVVAAEVSSSSSPRLCTAAVSVSCFSEEEGEQRYSRLLSCLGIIMDISRCAVCMVLGVVVNSKFEKAAILRIAGWDAGGVSGVVVGLRVDVSVVGGVLIIVTALVCLFFAVAWGFWPQLGGLVLGVVPASPFGISFIGMPGILAFALGYIAGRASMLKRRFWFAVVCGNLSLIPAFWVLLVSFSILSSKSMYASSIRFPIWIGLLVTAFAPAVGGLILVAASNKEFS